MTSSVQVVSWSDICACGVPVAGLPMSHWRGAMVAFEDFAERVAGITEVGRADLRLT